jgi:hypothetical protein
MLTWYIVILSWDTFPPPPPEAKDWKPDPGSIPKPGTLKDPRFHKDPHAEEKKAAMKREMRLHGSAGSSSTSVSIAPPVRAPIGGWPTQLPRANGSVHARETAMLDNIVTSPIGSTTTTTKGTMESLPIMPLSSYRPLTPTPTVKSVSSAKSVVPLWAGPLEKALAEPIREVRSIPAQGSAISIPPHLRNAGKNGGNVNGSRPGQAQGRSLDPAAATYQPADLESHYQAAREASRRVSDTTISETIVDEEDSRKDEALARRMATTDLAVHDAKHICTPVSAHLQRTETTQGPKPQQSMLNGDESKLPATHTSTPTSTPGPTPATNGNNNGNGTGTNNCNSDPPLTHSHYLKASLILQMERDLQEDKLMALSEDQLDQLLVEVSTLHQQWYTGKQGNNLGSNSDIDQGEAVSRASKQGDIGNGNGVRTKAGALGDIT